MKQLMGVKYYLKNYFFCFETLNIFMIVRLAYFFYDFNGKI